MARTVGTFPTRNFGSNFAGGRNWIDTVSQVAEYGETIYDAYKSIKPYTQKIGHVTRAINEGDKLIKTGKKLINIGTTARRAYSGVVKGYRKYATPTLSAQVASSIRMPPRRSVKTVGFGARANYKRRPAGRVLTRKPIRSVGTANYRSAGFIGIEKKFSDKFRLSAAIVAPANAAGGELDPILPSVFNTLSGVAQGDGEQERDGRVIHMKEIYITGEVECLSQNGITTSDPATMVFLALVLDTQTNGTQLKSEDVFVNPSADKKGAASPLRNLQFSSRFRVLDTTLISLQNPSLANNGSNLSQSGLVRHFKLSKSFGEGIQVQFTATGDTVASIQDNSLHILGYCRDISLVPKITYNSRLRFVG